MAYRVEPIGPLWLDEDDSGFNFACRTTRILAAKRVPNGPVTRSRPTRTVGARNGREVFRAHPRIKKSWRLAFDATLQRGALAIIHLETSSAKTSAHASVGCWSGEKYHRVSVDLSGMRAHIAGIIDTNLILGA